ncbi:uncharacterized protein LOC122381016 isoform X4 [Amphibalanus amphitrite]|uniref:uncharacterized protein LOC122381016 isoform X4 n=1 Tax=Amphibalanus amphitrite TaxID=1232801 RepID=UPI001C90E3A9|nr:uncharacterized protein LOC122381016 isoform X4 [Amphibalanus amphitrite]
MTPQHAAGVSLFLGASFLAWNAYRAKQRNDKERALSAGTVQGRESERSRQRVRFAHSDTVLTRRRRSLSTEIEYRQRLSSDSSLLVNLPGATVSASSAPGPSAPSPSATTVATDAASSRTVAGGGADAATPSRPAAAVGAVAAEPAGGDMAQSVTSLSSDSSRERGRTQRASSRAWSAPPRRQLSPKTSRELIDHDPSAIIHPVLDHSKGVDETDETQFFAYTFGQGLFRSGPQDPSDDTDLGALVSPPSATSTGKRQTSRWRPPQRRKAITFKRQQKFGVDVRPIDSCKSDFSFVLLCTSDEEIPLACTTALSLRKEGTTASIACIVALPTELSSQRRLLLQLHMDEILVARQLAEQTALAPLLTSRPQLALLLLWKLPRWRCVFVSNHCLAIRCADTLFHTGADFAAVQALGSPSLDVTMFSAKPSNATFGKLAKMALTSPAADVSTLLNSYLGTANHLSRVPMDQADGPERFCRVSVLFNFTRERLQKDTILPSVKIFNFGSALPVWLDSGLPDDVPAVVAKLFARWSVLRAIIDPELPCGAGERSSAPPSAHGELTAPYESAPWHPSQATVEEVVAADHRAEKIKPTTETYGSQPPLWRNTGR